jgi:hypothetical protein
VGYYAGACFAIDMRLAGNFAPAAFARFVKTVEGFGVNTYN